MKNTKITLIPASLFRHSRIEAYLEKKAVEGWLLEAASGLFFRFRRMEPKKLRYEVVNFPEGVTERNLDEAYAQRRREAAEEKGWKLAARQGGFLIFYTEQLSPVPVAEDVSRKHEDTQRQLKKQLAGMAVFAGAYIVLMLASVVQAVKEPVEFWVSTPNLLILAIYLLLLLAMVGQWISLRIWCRKAKASEKQGGAYREYHANGLFIWGFCGIALVLTLAAVLYMKMGVQSLTIMVLLGMLAVIVPLVELLGVLPRKGLSEKARKVIAAAAVVLTILCSNFALTMAEDRLPEGGYKKRITGTYETKFGYTLDLHDDEMPLTVADFYVGEREQANRFLHQAENSPALSVLEAEERHWDWAVLPWLNYTVYTVKMPFLYDDCLEDIDSLPEMPGDPAPWGAKEVYIERIQNEGSEVYRERYLVLWEDRIVYLDWISTEGLTNEQIQIIAEKLNPGAR